MKYLLIAVLTVGIMGVLFVGTPLTASAGSDKYTNEDVNSLLNSGQYGKTVEAAEYVTSKDSSNADAWLKLAIAQYMLKNYHESIAAYKEADKLGFASQLARYNTACCYGLLGDEENAEKWLNMALEAGFSDAEQLRSDSDLELLHDSGQFADYVKRAKVNGSPCEYDTNNRQLDFWIGQWEVYNPQGTMVGTNRIEKSLNGCLLLENWKSVLGSTGKSMNFYNKADKSWNQQWVSSKGQTIWYDGEFWDGKMIFTGEMVKPDGSTALSRMTLSPNKDGTVSQLIEQSPDNGKSWNVAFDGKYVKKEVASSK